ncbi:hypothetical protein ACQEV4_44185 [Streptomyces shenzhenensis]|uniref:hypothetical protein n=1 Tax=Streptomyces shenzhenensis TaxID=943815 RepID=UPI003D90F9B7
MEEAKKPALTLRHVEGRGPGERRVGSEGTDHDVIDVLDVVTQEDIPLAFSHGSGSLLSLRGRSGRTPRDLFCGMHSGLPAAHGHPQRGLPLPGGRGEPPHPLGGEALGDVLGQRVAAHVDEYLVEAYWSKDADAWLGFQALGDALCRGTSLLDELGNACLAEMVEGGPQRQGAGALGNFHPVIHGMPDVRCGVVEIAGAMAMA